MAWEAILPETPSSKGNLDGGARGARFFPRVIHVFAACQGNPHTPFARDPRLSEESDLGVSLAQGFLELAVGDGFGVPLDEKHR